MLYEAARRCGAELSTRAGCVRRASHGAVRRELCPGPGHVRTRARARSAPGVRLPLTRAVGSRRRRRRRRLFFAVAVARPRPWSSRVPLRSRVARGR
jgi:hypothetical protein